MSSKECEEQLKNLIYDWETEGLLTKIYATDIEVIKHLLQENKQLKEHIEKYEHYCKTTGIEELMKENKKYKEVIDKAIKYINDNLIISSVLDGKKYYTINDYSFDYKELLDILKEVE